MHGRKTMRPLLFLALALMSSALMSACHKKSDTTAGAGTSSANVLTLKGAGQ